MLNYIYLFKHIAQYIVCVLTSIRITEATFFVQYAEKLKNCNYLLQFTNFFQKKKKIIAFHLLKENTC